MIRLSAEQFVMIEDVALHRFIGRVVDELPSYVGPWVTHKPRPVLFATVQAALRLARDYDITTERDLFQYANLAVMMGARFDIDPAFPWATAILRDPSYLVGRERMDDLWNTATDYLDDVLGTESPSAPAAAFRRYLRRAEPSLNGATVPKLAALDLRSLWPEKAAILPLEDAESASLAAAERAAGYGIQDVSLQLRYCRIAHLLGTYFDVDPLHDWVGDALAQKEQFEVVASLEAAFVSAVIEPALQMVDRENKDMAQ
jgi:hypothetical protein